MNRYKVVVIETYEKEIWVEAESADEAYAYVEERLALEDPNFAVRLDDFAEQEIFVDMDESEYDVEDEKEGIDI